MVGRDPRYIGAIGHLKRKFKAGLIGSILEPIFSFANLRSILAFWARCIIRWQKPTIVIVAGAAGKSSTAALIATVLSRLKVGVAAGVNCSLENISDETILATRLLRYKNYFVLPWRYSSRIWLVVSLPFRSIWIALVSRPQIYVVQSTFESIADLNWLLEITQPKVLVLTPSSRSKINSDESHCEVRSRPKTLFCETRQVGLLILPDEYFVRFQSDFSSQAVVVNREEYDVKFSRRAAAAICRHIGISEHLAASALADLLGPGDGTVDENFAAVHLIHKVLGIPQDYSSRRMPYYSEATDLHPVLFGIVDRTCWMTAKTSEQWQAMRAAAELEGVAISARVAFRSIDEQVDLIVSELRTGTAMAEVLGKIAAPGYSQHHSGRAIDFASAPLDEDFGTSPAFDWLQRNASTFGFVMTYPAGNLYGIISEPWHWYIAPCDDDLDVALRSF